METLTEVTVRYLRAQVAAGVQVVQLFDSWMGDLGRREYEASVLPYSRRIFEAVRATEVPTIHFGTGTVGLLVDGRGRQRPGQRRLAGSAGRGLAADRPRQGDWGNLDPAVLLAPSRW